LLKSEKDGEQTAARKEAPGFIAGQEFHTTSMFQLILYVVHFFEYSLAKPAAE